MVPMARLTAESIRAVTDTVAPTVVAALMDANPY